MRIAIDASRTTVAARTGTENYALRLIQALLALKSAHEFILYFRDEPPPGLFPGYSNVKYRVIPLKRLWTHLRFAAGLWKDRPDVTFVPAHTLPLFFPGRSVATVHDLGYRFFPKAHPTFERFYLDLTTRFSAWRATRILADSEATCSDLVKQYGIDAAKIAVAYPGVENLHRVSDSQIVEVMRKYRLPRRYLLFLGTLQPRKNITRLIEAFVQYLNDYDVADSELSLVLAGKRGWLIDEPLEKVLGALPLDVRQRIILPGYIADEDVAAIYSGALGLIMPSLYEGFGFPVLEAMLCETPVICSRTSSLPELAGNAAILVDPLNVQSITDGIAWLAADPGLRISLMEKGKLQAAQFTWERAARQTLEVLELVGMSRINAMERK